MNSASGFVVDEIVSTLKGHLWAVVAKWQFLIVRDFLLCHSVMLPVLQAVYLTFNLYLLRAADRYPDES